MSCLDATALQAWVDGALGDAEREAATAHVDSCDECRRLIASLAMTTSGATSAEAPSSLQRARLDVDTTIDRFRITRHLGSGGMGIVYAAHDPELRREVAIKLLRQDGEGTPDAQARLLREAQAMAQVAHPNVIAVYDVGTWDGEVFLAMELATGGTLRTWCARASRAQILEAYVAAGRGLAAAHAVGLVHRDFKPDNVLVGADGRMRVTDFGLARSHDGPLDTPPVRPTPVPLAALTKTGTVMGTPGYMAAELYVGRAADARTDQFAFCVALWEALFGDRPYRGLDEAQLAAAVMAGAIVEPASTRGVSSKVVAALRRGLAADPAARWPTMDALLAALTPAPRRRAWVIAAGVVVVAGAASAIVIATRTTPAVAPRSFDVELAADARTFPVVATIGASQERMKQKDVPGAQKLAADAVAIARQVNSQIAMLHALGWQATLFHQVDDHPNEERALREVRRLSEVIGDDVHKTDATVRLAAVLDLEGKTEEANDLRAMGLATASRASADAETRANAIEAEAATIDDPDQSRPKWDEALALRDTLPGVGKRSMNRVQVATSLFLAERYTDARVVMVDAERVMLTRPADAMEKAAASFGIYQTLALDDIMLHRWADLETEARHLIAGVKDYPDTEIVAAGHVYLAVALFGRGDDTAARVEIAAAFAGAAKDPGVTSTLHKMIATFEREAGKLDDAVVHARAAYDYDRTRYGDEDKRTLLDQILLCKLLRADGKLDEARTLSQDLVTKRIATKAPPADIAEARFALARALPASERTHALELAHQAYEVMQTSGPHLTRARKQIEAWLADPDKKD